MRLKYYTCYALSNVFYTLGDIASKPLNMDWAQEDGSKTEWTCSIVYCVYNWLMLRSVYFNDLGGCDVWGDYESDDDPYEDEDGNFTPMSFTKEDATKDK